MFKNKYRITFVRDYYVPQTKKWWFPFIWFECWPRNGFVSIANCKSFIEQHKKDFVVDEM